MIKDQAERLKVLDTQKSFLIQAPAGSGKTALLVQRFLKTLAVVETAPEEIVAITFTRKAATEMRERILDALQLATNQAVPKDPYKQALWHLGKQVLLRDQKEGWQLLNNPARLKIQTIDALCAGITKQMPILSRFGAQPQIEQNARVLYETAVDQLMQALDHDHPYPSNKGLFKLLQHLDNDRRKVKQLLVHMLQIREHWLPVLAGHMHAENLRAHLEQGLVLACEEALIDLNAVVPEALDVTIMSHHEPQTLDEWLIIIEKLLTQEGSWRKTVGVDQGFHPPSKAKNKQEKQRLKECKDAMIAMLERLRPHEDFRRQLLVLRELPTLVYNDQQWEIISALMQVLPILAAQLMIVFRDQGQVDFIAVSLAALGALQDQNAPSDLSLALDCKIRHILVDEFQDTSHTQFNLLERLTANWDQGDGKTLFLVGDPMQSIYRFRQADVGLFLKAKEQGIGNIQLEFVQLKVNFRSTANVIDWINQTFTSSFPNNDNKTLGAISYMPAEAAVISIEHVQAVTCLAVSEESEPQAIIDLIQQSQQQHPDYSIAVLVRAKSHLVKLLPALKSAGIVYQGTEIENLSTRPIIQDLLALSNAVLHLDDRIAWLALLRAPWCAISLADLQIIAAFDGTIYHALSAPEVANNLSQHARMRIQRLALVMYDALLTLGRISFATLIKNTFWSLGGNYRGQELEETAVTAFFNMLQNIGHKAEIHTPGFLQQQLDNFFAPPTNVTTKAVQIMTMHKSKGLEFDIVILPSLSKATRAHEQQLLLLDKRDYTHEYLLFAPIRAADQSIDSIYNYLAWCERQRTEHEILRLLYVAATRAKHKIYCLADINPERAVGGMLGKIWSHVVNQFIISPQYQVEPLQRNLKLQRLPEQWFIDNQYPDFGITLKPRQIKHWQINWVSQAGTVMHRILCHIAKHGFENLSAQYLQDLPQLCLRYLHNIGMLESERGKAQKLIIDAISKMLQDDFGKHILSCRHKGSYSEWSLTKLNLIAPASDGVQPLAQFNNIRLDRVFVDQDDTIWLIDYKLVPFADNVPDAIAKNHDQVFAYAHALIELKPETKLVAGLYFPLQAIWHQVC